MSQLSQYMIPEGYSLFASDLEETETLLDDAWDALRSARIFLTGGTGFFGIWLVESLLWANERHKLGLSVTVLTRSVEKFLTMKAPHLRGRSALRFIEGGLTDFEIPTAAPDTAFTHIIHAASETNLEQSADWASRHLAAAIDGTRRLLDMAGRHGTGAVLVTTSGAVYSPMDSVSADSRCVEVPASVQDYASERIVYGQAKRMMEVMSAVAAMEHGFRALVARSFCFVGPYLPLESNYAVGNFIRDALDEREIIVSGDGTPLRSYLYPVDLVVWLLKILVSGRSGVPYNVGGERAVSIGELAQTVASVANHTKGVKIKGTPIPGARPSAYLPSLQRTREQLGVNVTVDIEEALRRTLAWHRMRREGHVATDRC